MYDTSESCSPPSRDGLGRSQKKNPFGWRTPPFHLLCMLEAGSGMYYTSPSRRTSPGVRAECLGGRLSVVGQKVELTVTTEAGTKILRVVSDQLEQKVGEREATMKLKDLYSEEERDV
eukprot:Sspe_Gene.24460::Locus_9706_Transcript_1_2_Confidence_0.500_Length_489::g.24460::m.24460